MQSLYQLRSLQKSIHEKIHFEVLLPEINKKIQAPLEKYRNKVSQKSDYSKSLFHKIFNTVGEIDSWSSCNTALKTLREIRAKERRRLPSSPTLRNILEKTILILTFVPQNTEILSWVKDEYQAQESALIENYEAAFEKYLALLQVFQKEHNLIQIFQKLEIAWNHHQTEQDYSKYYDRKPISFFAKSKKEFYSNRLALPGDYEDYGGVSTEKFNSYDYIYLSEESEKKFSYLFKKIKDKALEVNCLTWQQNQDIQELFEEINELQEKMSRQREIVFDRNYELEVYIELEKEKVNKYRNLLGLLQKSFSEEISIEIQNTEKPEISNSGYFISGSTDMQPSIFLFLRKADRQMIFDKIYERGSQRFVQQHEEDIEECISEFLIVNP